MTAHLNEHRQDWPPRRVNRYGALSVGQSVYYSRSKSRGRSDVAGEFEIVSLGPCETGVIVDMTDGSNQVRAHIWISANELGHVMADVRETFRIVRNGPTQTELRI